METPSDSYIIYPIHLNSAKSQRNGRRYPINKTVSEPKYREIKTALETLNLKFIEEPTKKHPKDFVETGRFKICSLKSKKDIAGNICSTIKSMREKNNLGADKSKTANFLKLVPKSKKKSKQK